MVGPASLRSSFHLVLFFFVASAFWGAIAPLAVAACGGGGHWLADVNGDGRLDLVIQYDGTDGLRHWRVLLSNGTSYVDSGDWQTTNTPGVSVVGVGDLNGDGKADLIVQYDWGGSRRWQGWLSTGSSFAWNGDWTTTNTPGVSVVGVGDLNGDGKADLIVQYDWGGLRRWQGRLSTGSSFAWNGDWQTTNTPGVSVVGVGDLNGDGHADLIVQYDWGGLRRWQGWLSTGSSFAWNGDWTTTNTPGVSVVGVGDLNGDGKADLVMQYDWGGLRRWQGRLSTGSSFAWNGDWTTTNTPGVSVVGVGDLNGDGKADLVMQYDWGGLRRWQGRLSTGSSFAWNGDWTTTNTPGVSVVGVGDLNGDGKADLAMQYDWGGLRRWQGRLSTGSSFAWNGDWYSMPVTDSACKVVLVGSAANMTQVQQGNYSVSFDFFGGKTESWIGPPPHPDMGNGYVWVDVPTSLGVLTLPQGSTITSAVLQWNWSGTPNVLKQLTNLPGIDTDYGVNTDFRPQPQYLLNWIMIDGVPRWFALPPPHSLSGSIDLLAVGFGAYMTPSSSFTLGGNLQVGFKPGRVYVHGSAPDETLNYQVQTNLGGTLNANLTITYTTP
jgi:FG-GAP-like repeat/FG-GAP repeat